MNLDKTKMQLSKKQEIEIRETGKKLFKYLIDKRLLGALAEHMLISRELKLSRIERLGHHIEYNFNDPSKVLNKHRVWLNNKYPVKIPYNRYVYTVETTIDINSNVQFSYETELFFSKLEYSINYIHNNSELPQLVTGYKKIDILTEEIAQTFKSTQWARYNTYTPHNGDLKCGHDAFCPSTIFNYACQKCNYNLNNNYPTKIYTKNGYGPNQISIPEIFTNCPSSNMPTWYLPTTLEDLFVSDLEFIEHFSKNFNEILPLLRILAEDIEVKDVEDGILTKISARNTRLQEAMKLFLNNFLKQREQALAKIDQDMYEITNNNPFNIIIDELKHEAASLSESFHCILLDAEDEMEYLNKRINNIKKKMTEYKTIRSDIPIDREYFIMKDIETATVINDLIENIEVNKTLCNMSLDIKKVENLNNSVSNIMKDYKEHRNDYHLYSNIEALEKMNCLLDQIEATINKYCPETLNPINILHVQKNNQCNTNIIYSNNTTPIKKVRIR